MACTEGLNIVSGGVVLVGIVGAVSISALSSRVRSLGGASAAAGLSQRQRRGG
jgi:hypothetical protein